jgi:hypothetical protein
MLPAAIREDHDPLKWLTGIGLGTLLAFGRWSDFRCPHCRDVFRRTYLPRGVVLGGGRRTCPSCKESFDDESREWPTLTVAEKIQYLFPTPIMGVIGALLLCIFVVIYAMAEWPGSVNGTFTTYLATFLALSLVLWSGMRVPQIVASVKRHAARRKVS